MNLLNTGASIFNVMGKRSLNETVLIETSLCDIVDTMIIEGAVRRVEQPCTRFVLFNETFVDQSAPRI